MQRQWITDISFSLLKRGWNTRGQPMLPLPHKDTQKPEQGKGVYT